MTTKTPIPLSETLPVVAKAYSDRWADLLSITDKPFSREYHDAATELLTNWYFCVHLADVLGVVVVQIPDGIIIKVKGLEVDEVGDDLQIHADEVSIDVSGDIFNVSSVVNPIRSERDELDEEQKAFVELWEPEEYWVVDGELWVSHKLIFHYALLTGFNGKHYEQRYCYETLPLMVKAMAEFKETGQLRYWHKDHTRDLVVHDGKLFKHCHMQGKQVGTVDWNI